MINPPRSCFDVKPPNAWSTLPTFNNRRAESLIELHRGFLDASRYDQSESYRKVRDELRAAYVTTPSDVRVTQWLNRQQKRRESFWEEQFRQKWNVNGEPEGWEVVERQKWLQQHQQPAPQRRPQPQLDRHDQPQAQQPQEEAVQQPEDPQPAVPKPQPQRQPTPQQPSGASDSEPEFQQPSTSAASDRSNRKRRQVVAPSTVPARRPRRSPVAPVVAPQVEAVPVEQQPMPEAVQPRRQQPAENPQNADIEKRDLPDAPPVVVGLKVIVDQKLAAKDQKQVIRRLDFKAIRYGNGIVIAQGNLVGLKYQPGLNWGFVYNDPSDPVVSMDGGDEHLILMTQNGHIFTIGRNAEGQLGSSRRPGVYRQRHVGQSATRLTVLLKKKTPNGKTKKEHAIFKGISACGNTSSAITVDDTMFHCGDGLGPVLG
uniref:Homeobox domain-containing protein n=1 Tax=Panagrellus redivivus TaxID=6233 RepID=A0A7E4UY66_PANRE